MTWLELISFAILGCLAVAGGVHLVSRHWLHRRRIVDDGYLVEVQEWDVPEDWAA